MIGILITGGYNEDGTKKSTEAWSTSGQFHCSLPNFKYPRYFHTQNKRLGINIQRVSYILIYLHFSMWGRRFYNINEILWNTKRWFLEIIPQFAVWKMGSYKLGNWCWSVFVGRNPKSYNQWIGGANRNYSNFSDEISYKVKLLVCNLPINDFFSQKCMWNHFGWQWICAHWWIFHKPDSIKVLQKWLARRFTKTKSRKERPWM